MIKMKIPAAERLAQALHSEGLFEMETKARSGYYGEFTSPLATPKFMQLVCDLNARGKPQLARRAMEGEFDGK